MSKFCEIVNNRDIVHIICGFLQVGDTCNISNVNKTLKGYSLLFYFVKTRLREKGVVIPNGFSISGSFLLNIISKFDNNENPGDIDIYTNLKPGEELNSIFDQQGYEPSKFKHLYNRGNSKYIDGVQAFKKVGFPKIDVIFVNSSVTVHEMIEENFDMSCVKNWYDGKQLYIKDIVNTTGIGPAGKITKLENYKNTYWKRFYKYLRRGYTIDNCNRPIFDTIIKISNFLNTENVFFYGFRDIWNLNYFRLMVLGRRWLKRQWLVRFDKDNNMEIFVEEDNSSIHFRVIF